MWFAILATIIIGALLYKIFLSGSGDYWKKLGILEIDTSPALGILDIVFSRKAMTAADDYCYDQMGSSHKYCGTFQMGKPLLIIKDEEVLKKILIKDFDHFVDRRQFFNEDDGVFKHMLPSLEGDEWKGVRSSVSPTFTTGKIRRMMDLFNEVGKEWANEVARKAKSNSNGSVTADVVEIVNTYTLEVISNAVFGMAAGVIKNPDSKFAKMANRMSEFGKIQVIKLTLKINFPRLCTYLGFTPFDIEALSFFETILAQGLKSRMSGEIKRNDFLQLMVEARKGELKAAGNDELDTFEKDAQISTAIPKKQYLTDNVMNAQSLVFFFAGFSSTSSFITFALYALALHPEIQDKLRQEVNKIVKDDGSFDYDEVGQLVYLDMVLCEVLRMFPAAARLERICVKDYKDAETGLTIPKGTTIGVPVNAIHHNKKYYEFPEKFYPEHFTPEKKTARSPYAYLPFGTGPRNCIGMRFAQIEGKSAIAHMIHHFIVEPTATTPVPFQGRPAGLNFLPPKKLELKFTPISKT